MAMDSETWPFESIEGLFLRIDHDIPLSIDTKTSQLNGFEVPDLEGFEERTLDGFELEYARICLMESKDFILMDTNDASTRLTPSADGYERHGFEQWLSYGFEHRIFPNLHRSYLIHTKPD